MARMLPREVELVPEWSGLSVYKYVPVFICIHMPLVFCSYVHVAVGRIYCNSYYRPVAGYVNLCPNDISTEPHNLHQMHATLKHEILHALVSGLRTACPGEWITYCMPW